ncbi:hypothetical protein [Rhodovibrio salinarum]|uniref:Uncharacterized protein n=1 Tax=Rhodovibrio salinarum TaxID=1087 RepID=A0A934V0P9_9PROT|nr:hypothetical protein [Rhodovibrio salinarum]MBK1698517.1 hypothetical protein [Rhodovibrio salinarum]
MARLSTNDILDFAIVFLADEAAPRLREIPCHMRQLSGGWFSPCTEVIRGRVEALVACSFLRVSNDNAFPAERRVHATDGGLAYAQTLPRKVAPQACLPLLVWRGLQMSLAGRMTSDARSALMLELAHHEAALPPMADLANDFAAIQQGGLHGAG